MKDTMYVSPQVTTIKAGELIEVLGPASAGAYAQDVTTIVGGAPRR